MLYSKGAKYNVTEALRSLKENSASSFSYNSPMISYIDLDAG